MKLSLVLITFAFSLTILGQQQDGKVWLQTGVKNQFKKNWEWSIDLTNRFGSDGLETFFSQASIKYKVTKWLRPSVDYRSILDKDKYGNYAFSNRLNINTDLKHTINRWGLAMRVRYQYSFSGSKQSSYDAEFDQAIRLKPQIRYDIKKSKWSPIWTIEFFYNPSYGPAGRQFTKYRMFSGAQLDLKGPHNVALGYILDQELNTVRPDTKHILNVSYSLDLGALNKSDKKDKKSGYGDLFNE
jgi:hypothetical protein